MNPGDREIIGLAVRRRTKLGHPDIQIKKEHYLIKLMLTIYNLFKHTYKSLYFKSNFKIKSKIKVKN